MRAVAFSGLVRVVMAVLALASCGRSDSRSGGAPLPAVTVAKPLQREIVEWDEFTGRFEAVDSVEIRARVSGYLDSVHFVDGAIVKKGDLLFIIDPRPYEAALRQAEAEIGEAQAKLSNAERDLERGLALVRSQNIPQQTVDQRRADRDAAAGALDAAKARADTARLNLEFTHVMAPISGRISRKLVSEGNLVSGGDTGATLLTTIVSLDPIHFYFDADEQTYIRYTRLQLAGKRPSSRDVPNPVMVGLSDEPDFPHLGHMDFVENQIDPNTGTMRGRAILDNPGFILTPGEFGRLRLIASNRYPAIQVPDDAIATDQSRKLLYVVDGDGAVTAHQVELGPLIDGLRVIRSGIGAEDRIVIRGLQRVRAGAKVAATETSLPVPPPVQIPAFAVKGAAEKPAAPAGQGANAGAASGAGLIPVPANDGRPAPKP